MISNIKALLVATGQFKDVQLAQDLQPVEDLAANTPSAVIYQGKTVFGESLLDNLVMQAADKTVDVIFICVADDVETIENLVLSTLMGFQYTSDYSALEAVQAENYKIEGHFYARRVTFQTRVHVSES